MLFKYSGLILCALSLHHALSVDYMEEVGKFMNEFSQMTGTAADVLENLDKISKGAFSLLKFAGPIGTLVHAGMDAMFETESDVEKAISELQDTVKAKFEDLSKKMDAAMQRQEYFAVMNDYSNFITLHLHWLEDRLEWALNKTLQATEDFVQKCNGASGPSMLLQWLNTRVNLNCIMPSNAHAKRHAHLQNLFVRIEHSADDWYNTTSCPSLKKQVIDAISYLSHELAHKQIRMLEYALLPMIRMHLNGTLLDKIVCHALHVNLLEINAHHRKQRQDPINCLLQTASNNFDRKREPLLNIARLITDDLAEIELLEIICTSVTTIGRPHLAQNKLEKLDKSVKSISKKLRAWILNELDSSWPDVIKVQAQKTIGMEKIAEDPEQYRVLASKIRGVADDGSLKKYLHQVLVAPAWEQNTYFYAECANDKYCLQFEWSQIRVFITRFDLTDYGNLVVRLKYARTWFGNSFDKISKALKKGAEDNSGDLTKVMTGIATELWESHVFGVPKKFASADLFSNLAVVRNSKWLAKHCTIPLGLATSHVGGATAYNDSMVCQTSPYFTNANCYKLVLFI